MTTELKKIVKLRMIEVVIKFTGTTKQERLQICADDYHRDPDYAIFSSWIKKHKENHPYPIYHFARGIFENQLQHYAAEESTTKMSANTKLNKLNERIDFYQNLYIDIARFDFNDAIDRKPELQKLIKKINLLENMRESEKIKMNDIYTKSHFSGWHKKTEIEALEFAKWLIRAITTCKNNSERLAIVNNRLRGIQFTLNDLQIRND